MVYALKPEETAGFSEWWAEIEEHGIYEEPNSSKALHDVKDVSETTAMVPITISRAFELCLIILTICEYEKNLDRRKIKAYLKLYPKSVEKVIKNAGLI